MEESSVIKAESFLKSEVYPLRDTGLTDKEIATKIKKRNILKYYKELLITPAGNLNGEQLLYWVEKAVMLYRRENPTSVVSR
ncbi:hypothetical protein D3C71_1313490 [compost metagenome]